MDEPRRGRPVGRLPARYWPNAREEEQAIAEPLNSLPKYVASTTQTFFRDDGALRPLRLVAHEVATTGAILATYARAES